MVYRTLGSLLFAVGCFGQVTFLLKSSCNSICSADYLCNCFKKLTLVRSISSTTASFSFICLQSTIYFKLAEITNGNELENSKYGHISRTANRLQMVSKSRDFWQGERKRLILPANMLGILI